MKLNTKGLALSALLVAVMMITGYIEHMIPTGVPGIKLGLSNSVLLIALYWLGVPNSFLLMGAKVLLSGVTFAGLGPATLYSLAGGLLSLVGMALLHRVKDISPIGVGVVGGVLHNVGQLAVAMAMLGTNLLLPMSYLIVVGGIMGAVTGSVAQLLMRRLPPSMRPPRS
ncbi:Gx transporter family protein [Bacillota bacterium Meth-B3]|nr:Gx transporter family protein [Christensenellaceae bacterium]